MRAMDDATRTNAPNHRRGIGFRGRRLRTWSIATLGALGVQGAMVTTAHADEDPHYWVYFADKGLGADAKAKALQNLELSPRAIARRTRVRNGAVVDERDLAVASAYVDAVTATGATLRVKSRWFNAVTVAADKHELAKIRALPAVVAVEPVRRGVRSQPVIVPDPAVPAPGGTSAFDYGMAQQQLDLMNVPAAHECGLTGTGVVVGVLDTGFQTGHSTFAELDIIATYDFINGDETVSNESVDAVDQHNHGTSVLSLIAGNTPGTHMGVAPNVSVLLAKTEWVSEEIEMEEDWYVAGLEWVESMGADIMTSSLGYLDWYEFEDFDGQTAKVTQAVNIAVGNGLIALTAMGNEGPNPNSIIAPADSEAVLSIGATDFSGQVVGFSSRGPTADGRIKPNLVAPGANTHVANAAGGFGTGSGTSYATPLTAGAVALIVEANPGISPADLRALLEDTAILDGEPNNDYGWGLVDVGAAVADVCNCTDADADGFPAATCGGNDCDDANASVNPDAQEVCDGIDNNCDGQIDEVDCGDGGDLGDSGGTDGGLDGGLDGGIPPAEEDEGDAACACVAGSRSPLWAWFAPGLLVLTIRRRRSSP